MPCISDNVKSVLDRVSEAAVLSGRDYADIVVVAASKTNGYPQIREAFDSGIRYFGENRVQELLEKQQLNAYENAQLHFIGHLQRNKVKYVVGNVSLIHSVDSPLLLADIDKIASVRNITQDILLEVNISGEATKSGFSPEKLPEMLFLASQCTNLCVRGLMTVPPKCDKSDNNALLFDRIYQLFVDNKSKKYDNVCMDFMSMGMSDDFECAITHGANMVRIGSAIFGPRYYSASEVPADGFHG